MGVRSSVCSDRKRARRTASTQFAAATQSAFQEKFSYTMAVRGLLGGGSMIMRRVRAFVVANEMGWDEVPVVVCLYNLELR